MRDPVKNFLDQDLSRRGFLKDMAAGGFTTAAAGELVLQNLVLVTPYANWRKGIR